MAPGHPRVSHESAQPSYGFASDADFDRGYPNPTDFSRYAVQSAASCIEPDRASTWSMNIYFPTGTSRLTFPT